MTHHPELERTPTDTKPAEPRTTKPWPTEVGELLTKAAELCVEHGVDLDAWMRSAWSSYVESRPGLREELEERRLIGELEELRKAGRVGEA